MLTLKDIDKINTNACDVKDMNKSESTGSSDDNSDIEDYSYNSKAKKLKEHTKKLKEHTKELKEHTKKLKDHMLKWDFSYEVIDEKSESYYILETLDDVHYRALAPWLDTKNLLINKFRIKQLLDYINNPNRPNRISNYQAVSNKKASANMFLRKPMKVDELEEQAKDIDTHIIRNDLFLKVTRIIRDIIEKDYGKGKKIKSDVDINNIIHDHRIRDIFINSILKLYEIGAKFNTVKEFEAGKFPFYEVLSSFIVELEEITRRFMKDMHDLYNREPLNASIFDLQEYDKLTEITKKIEESVNKAIQTVISDKDNIYSTMNYKYLLLNFH